MDTQEQRHYIDAKLQVALELLAKAQVMVSIAWKDKSARSNLAYVDAMAQVSAGVAADAAVSSRELYESVVKEETLAERSVGLPS